MQVIRALQKQKPQCKAQDDDFTFSRLLVKLKKSFSCWVDQICLQSNIACLVITTLVGFMELSQEQAFAENNFSACMALQIAWIGLLYQTDSLFVELAGKKFILVIGALIQVGVYVFLKKVWGYYLMQMVGAMLL